MGINASRLEENNEQLYEKIKKLSRKKSSDQHEDLGTNSLSREHDEHPKVSTQNETSDLEMETLN